MQEAVKLTYKKKKTKSQEMVNQKPKPQMS